MAVRRACAALLLLVCASGAAGQAADGPAAEALDLEGYIAPEEEAPAALLSLAIGDAEVSVLATGTWRLGLSLGGGFRVSPSRGLAAPVSVASLASGFAVSQEPSLALSVGLEERYFVEAGVSGASGQTEGSELLPPGLGYLSLRYAGREDELLRGAVIGTRGVQMNPYAFVRVPAMGPSSLGAGARLGTDRAAQELLLRVDKIPEESVLFIGMNRVDERRLEAGAYLRGQLFLFPDAGVRELAVLLEDADGELEGDDGRRYRRIAIDDGSVSAASGTVTLSSPARGRLLVWYRDASGREVGDPALGRAFLPAAAAGGRIDPDAPGVGFSWGESWMGRPLSGRRVTVSGRGYLRLYEPGEFSPFEVPSSYPLGSTDALAAVAVDTVRRGSGLPAESAAEVSYVLYPAEGRFAATLGEEARASVRERFPFADPDGLLYGPLANAPHGCLDFEIRVRSLVPVDSYQLPGPVIPGSVRVLRNGVEESGFSVDSQSGRVDLAVPAASGDTVLVSYRSASSSSAPADIVLAWGNRLDVGRSASLELAGGLLWSALPGAFSEEPFQSRGGVAASAALKGTVGGEEPRADGTPPRVNAALDYELAAGVSVSQPDTTGLRRLFGMEGDGATVSLTEAAAFPSAVPAAVPALPAGLDESTRGTLVYRDYRQYGALGAATLLRYDTPSWPPEEQVHAYEDGGVTGAYQVGGSSLASGGTSLALEFTMDAGERWVGMQLPTPDGSGREDLSWVEGVALSLAAFASEGSYEVYLQIGALGEDLDGDGVLDEEPNAESAGFRFDDAANRASLLVGAGPLGKGDGLLQSEDVDGDSFLDREDPEQLVTFGPGDPGGSVLVSRADLSWLVASRRLSPQERARLSASRAVRLLVVKSSAGACSGRLLVDRLDLLGSAFWARTAGGGEATARELRESDLPPSRRPAVTLEQAFPEVATRLHASGSAQQVLEVAWEDADPASLLVRGYLSPGTGGIAYRELRLYLRLPELALASGSESAALKAELLDAAGRGVHAGFSTGGCQDWAELVVEMDGGGLALDGEEPAGASLAVDGDAGDLVELRVTVDGAVSGCLYLDEVRLASARAGVGFAVEAGAELRLEGPLVTVGGLALVTSLELEERLRLVGAGFSPLYGTPAAGTVLRSSTRLGVDTAFGRIEAFAVVDASPSRTSASGGQRIAIRNFLPDAWPVDVGLDDTFSSSGSSASRSAAHDTVLTASVGPGLALSAEVASTIGPGELLQLWRATASWSPLPAASLQATLDATKRAGGYELAGSWYLPWWIGTFRHVVPWAEGTDSSRRGRVELDLLASAVPVGLRVSGGIGFSSGSIVSGARRQDTLLDWELGLPLSLRLSPSAPELSVVPSYRTAVSLSTREPEGGAGFAGDLEACGAVLAYHAWMLAFVPGADVLSAAALDAVSSGLSGSNGYPLAAASWEPALSLRLSRGIGSRLRDLVLPVLLELTLGRSARLEGDIADAATNLSVALRSSALNLFGSSGAYPLLSFYDTDELSGTVRAELRVPLDPTTPPTLDLTVSHLVSVLTGRRFSAELENKLRVRRGGTEAGLSDVGALTVSWTAREGIPLPTPLTAGAWGERIRRARGTLGHAERLGVEVRAPFAEEGNGAALTLRHETTLRYEGLGLARVHAALGAELRSDSGAWAPGLGVEAGLEVELAF